MLSLTISQTSLSQRGHCRPCSSLYHSWLQLWQKTTSRPSARSRWRRRGPPGPGRSIAGLVPCSCRWRRCDCCWAAKAVSPRPTRRKPALSPLDATLMVAMGSVVQRYVLVVGRELVRAATGAPERGDKLCHLLALTLGRLRWRGAVLVVGAARERGLQGATSIRS